MNMASTMLLGEHLPACFDYFFNTCSVALTIRGEENKG